MWGEDADEWRPERFIEGVESMQKTRLGVIANLYGVFFSDVFTLTLTWSQCNIQQWRTCLY